MADETRTTPPAATVTTATATKATATKATVKKATAKKATAKKATARKATIGTSTAQRATVKRITAKKAIAEPAPIEAAIVAIPPGADDRPEAVYVMAALDAAGELSVQWESAGHELVGRVQDIRAHPMPTVSSDVVDALVAATDANDVAAYLSAQQSFADSIEASVKSVNAQYHAALGEYQTRLESTLRANQAKNAKLFADYVKAVKQQLTTDIDDPAKIYQLGWSLVAASQIAAAGRIA